MHSNVEHGGGDNEHDSSLAMVDLSLGEQKFPDSHAPREEPRPKKVTSDPHSPVLSRFSVNYPMTRRGEFRAQSSANCYYGVVFFFLVVFPVSLAGAAYAMGMPAMLPSESTDDSANSNDISVTPVYPVTQPSVITTDAVPGADDGFDTAHFFVMWFYMGVEMYMGIMDNSIGVPKTRSTVQGSVGVSRSRSFGSCAYGFVMLAGSFFVSLTMCLVHCEDPDAVRPYTALFLIFAGLARFFESGSHALLDFKNAATITHVPSNTKAFWVNPALGNPHVLTHHKKDENPGGLPMHPSNCLDWAVAVFGAAALSGASGALMQFGVCKEGTMAGEPNHGAGWAVAFFYLIPMLRHVKTLKDSRTRTARGGIGLGLKSIEMFAATVKACMAASPVVILMAALQVVKSSFVSFTTASHRVSEQRYSVDKAHRAVTVATQDHELDVTV